MSATTKPYFCLDIFDEEKEKEMMEDNIIERIRKESTEERDRNRSESTVKKTSFWIRKLQEEAERVGLKGDLLKMEPKKLDAALSSLILSMKRGDGGDYEVSTVHCMFSLIARFLKENNYQEDLETSPAFQMSRSSKATQVRKLKAAGKGNRPNRAMPLSLGDEEKLWNMGSLGSHSPIALIRTIWYLLSLAFGLRGRHEARQMRWGDVTLKKDSDGAEYLELNERLTKTRDGSMAAGSRAFHPKAFASSNKARCPVEFFKEYAKRRPAGSNTPDSPFFQAINHRRRDNAETWFSNGPLGKNQLGLLMKTGCEGAGVTGNVTNHSVRKTAVKRALDAGCPAEYTAQLTGHKNVSSLKGYAEACVEVQKMMCHSVMEGAKFDLGASTSPSSTSNSSNHVEFVFNNCSGVTINMSK